jgi:glycosyltransferase involved in cell wall biosynthesis
MDAVQKRPYATLEGLPDPPPDVDGWPWTDGSEQGNQEEEGEWPKISIVTPSYNQEEFIEAALRSVILQEYPNLEYIVIDGASDDGSVEVIEQYESWIDHWASEPDRGQSHALNKGFRQATGQIFGWVNSDDLLRPGALRSVARAYRRDPDAVAWVGKCLEVESDRTPIREIAPRNLGKESMGDWWRDGRFFQPSCFFDASTFREAGGLDERLHYAMDVDLWVRLAEHGEFVALDDFLSEARMYSGIKTWEAPYRVEAEKIALNVYNGQPKVAEKRLRRYVEEAVEYELNILGYRRLTRLLIERMKTSLRRLKESLWS